MEDVDIRYENGCIYMIQHKTDNTKEFYIGSSFEFKQRCSKHKTRCNNQNDKNYNLKVYKYIRENGGWNEWEIILLYDYPCKNRNQLELEEQRAIKKYKSTLNQFIPARTQQERYKDNKEKILQYYKEYYEDNKEKIAEKQKEYKEANKEKIAEKQKEYQEANKEKLLQYKKKYQEANKEKILQRNKEHYETNKEEILQKAKIYKEANKEKMSKLKKKHYEANKEKILQKLSIKINCDICNAIVCKHHIERHKKSQKCINYFKKN